MHTAVCMYSTIMISFRGLRPSNTPRPCVPFRPSVPEGEWAKPLPPRPPNPSLLDYSKPGQTELTDFLNIEHCWGGKNLFDRM